MNFKKTFGALCAIAMSATVANVSAGTNCCGSDLFNDNWKFQLQSSLDENMEHYNRSLGKTMKWRPVTLPHTAFIEPLVVINQWQGVCFYQKTFDVADYSPDKNYFIEFEGAMGAIDVVLNGQFVIADEGGYLPVVADLTPYLKASGNTIEVKLDSNDNPMTGAKPVRIMDFCNYGGLYRNVRFYSENKLYISNPNLVDQVAGGGVFVTTPVVSEKSSVVNVKTNVVNSYGENKNITVKHSIYDGDKLVAQQSSKPFEVAAQRNGDSSVELKVKSAKLWSPDAPNLYTLCTKVYNGDELVDSEKTRFGIREFKFVDNELYINGVKRFLRGCNRHQEYPFVGNALSDNAQYRDAKKIKDDGFDYIRLSHYPHSPAFMDACDELGLIVLDAIFGWQYYYEHKDFKENCYRQARNLIRRDRNHPCVIAWEVSLNETQMPQTFMQKLHDIVHAEYPSKTTYSAGWMHGTYDIYLQARQHRIQHFVAEHFDRPHTVSEYGDWEYYSTNAGLNQDNMPADERLANSTRQFRRDGEKSLLIQIKNVQEAHNDNMNFAAFGDCFWVVFDHNRGYHNQISAPGVRDIFRLPKYSNSFYASQRDIKCPEGKDCVLRICSNWDTFSDPNNICVLSNADEVELYVNDKLVARQSPDENKNTTNINHPPFTFSVKEGFTAGTLKAVAYKDGKEIMQSEVITPELPTKLRVWVDESGRQAEAGVNDVLFLYIAAEDENGTISPYYDSRATLELPKGVNLYNINEDVIFEAGIATAVISLEPSVKSGSEINITAKSVDGMHAKILEGQCSFSVK